MKKLYTISFTTILIISSLILNSCQKTENGTPGKDGNSNVISKLYTINSSNWLNNGTRWYTFLTVSDLTTSNINSAAVQLFFGTTNNNWVAVPYTEIATSNYFMGFITSPNYIQVTWENNISLGNNPNIFYSITTVNFKVVIIPPTARLSHPNLDLNNYNEIKKAFKLPD